MWKQQDSLACVQCLYIALCLRVYSSLSSNIYKLPLLHELGRFHQSSFTGDGGGGGEGGFRCCNADKLVVVRAGASTHAG